MTKAFTDYDLSIGPHYQGRTKFGEDLMFGQHAERMVQDIIESKTMSVFSHSKVEVKCDRMAHRTGNLFFEFKYKGRPSGIAATKAEWFAYDTELCLFLFRTAKLKAWLRTRYMNPYQPRALGDGNNSLGLLVPIIDIQKESFK